MTAYAPLRTNLPALDAVRAETQTRLIGALNNRLVEGLRTSARAASTRDRHAASAWITFRVRDAEVAIAPLLVGGGLTHLATTTGQIDAVAAAATLGDIEPLVAALERAIGDELHPTGVSPSAPDDAILLRLDGVPDDAALGTRLLVALPQALPIAPVGEATLAAPLLGRLRLRWHAAIAGPPVAASRLETLAAGDLLLLGIAQLRARLTLPGRRDTLGARLDLQTGGLTVDDDSPGETGRAADPAPDAALDWAQVKVATTIEIAGSSLSAAELAALGHGSVLPLPAAGGTLPVQVRAGETLVAEGELVAIGDGYGVLISAVDRTTEH